LADDWDRPIRANGSFFVVGPGSSGPNRFILLVYAGVVVLVIVSADPAKYGGGICCNTVDTND